MNDKNTDPPAKVPEEKVSLGIPDPEYPELGPVIGEFLKEKGMLPQNAGKAPKTGDVVRAVEVIPSSIAKMMATVATNAWRLKSKMTDGDKGEVKDEWKRLYRHVEAILESFAEVGLEIKDRTGEAFDYGLPEKVVTTQPRATITKELVIETLKPTIYFNHQILQRGEVVIATPETQQPTSEATL